MATRTGARIPLLFVMTLFGDQMFIDSFLERQEVRRRQRERTEIMKDIGGE